MDDQEVRSAALAAAAEALSGTEPTTGVLIAYAAELIPWINAPATVRLDVTLAIPGTLIRLHTSNGGEMATNAAVTDTSVVITATCMDAQGNPTGENISWSTDDAAGTILAPSVSADTGTWTGAITGTTGTVNVTANAAATAGVPPYLAQITVGPGPTVSIKGTVTVNP